MKAARLNLTIVKGITFGPLLINCKNAAGQPVDLTDWSVFAEVRVNPKAALAFSLEPEITEAAAGEITIGFTDEETQELPAGHYGWDLVLERPSGERLGPYVTGKLTVAPIYTQPEPPAP